MKITPKAAEIVRPEIRGDKQTPAKAPATGAAKRGALPDQVQFSAAGRALSAGTGLSAERTAEIRSRIQEGAYNSLAVVDQVARRILEAGDA